MLGIQQGFYEYERSRDELVRAKVGGSRSDNFRETQHA